MRVLLFGLVFISPPSLKKWLLKLFCRAKIGRYAHIGWFSAVIGRHIELGEHSAIRPLTLINLSGDLKLGNYSEISSFSLIYGSSSLIVGDGSYIGPQSIINADEEVRLGNGSALGPRCMIFTHGSFLPYTEGYWVTLAGVNIGNKVWCAAGVFIHPGVEIGNDSFVNARSVVTQSIPCGSIAEGNPAKVVQPIERARRQMSPRHLDFAVEQMLHDFARIGLGRQLGLKCVEKTKQQLCFRWHKQTYCIVFIPSTGAASGLDIPPGSRQIFMVNYHGWQPPQGAMVFDLTTMQTAFVSDPIHQTLRHFMLRYYGVRFHDSGLLNKVTHRQIEEEWTSPQKPEVAPNSIRRWFRLRRC